MAWIKAYRFTAIVPRQPHLMTKLFRELLLQSFFTLEAAGQKTNPGFGCLLILWVDNLTPFENPGHYKIDSAVDQNETCNRKIDN